MNRLLSRPVSIVTVAILALVLVASQGVLTVSAGSGKHWVAPLSGSEEVPPTDSKGTGVGKFKLSDDGLSISYKLIVANIDDVTQSHIHIAPAGTNGSVVAFLFGLEPAGVTVNGVLAEGTITAADLRGPLAGMTIADLVAAMEAGNAYVNVHTLAHSPGEIRGQIK